MHIYMFVFDGYMQLVENYVSKLKELVGQQMLCFCYYVDIYLFSKYSVYKLYR